MSVARDLNSRQEFSMRSYGVLFLMRIVAYAIFIDLHVVFLAGNVHFVMAMTTLKIVKSCDNQNY